MQYTQHLTIDVYKQEQFQYIHAVQFDHCARQLVVTPTANGEKLTIPSTATAVFRCLKHDGTSVMNPATVDAAAGTITFELTDQALACEGMARADVSIIDGSSVISTLTFFIMVEKAPTSDKQVESSNEFLYIVQVAAEVEQSAERAEAAAAYAEEAVKTAIDVAEEAAEAVEAARGASISANEASMSANNASSKAAEAANSATAARAAQAAAEQARDEAQGIAGGDFATRAELNHAVSGLATEEYVQQNGGKINSISVNGVSQTIDANKNVEITIPKELPEVTTADNDKFLMVVNGEWVATALSTWEGGSY